MTRPARTGRNSLVVALLTSVALLPMVLPGLFLRDPTRAGLLALGGKFVALLIPAGAGLLCLRWLPEEYGPRSRAVLALFLLCLTGVLVDLHASNVGEFNLAFYPMSNLEWQERLHRGVLAGDPEWYPHSYRFLPNSLTRLFEWLTGDFASARLVYRWTFDLFLLLAILLFARRYVDDRRAWAVLLLYALIYPITIRFYAGQLADPLSHLSFIVSFIALEIGAFPYFLLAVAVGSLAKESVAAMLGFYLLFYRGRPVFSWTKLLVASAATVAVVLGARFGVVGEGAFEYHNISGVDLDHVLANLGMVPKWSRAVLFSVGIFVPFVVLGWQRADPVLRRLILYLAPVLFVSSTMFSYLHESRNYVPLIVPMAIITADVLTDLLSPRPPPPRSVD